MHTQYVFFRFFTSSYIPIQCTSQLVCMRNIVVCITYAIERYKKEQRFHGRHSRDGYWVSGWAYALRAGLRAGIRAGLAIFGRAGLWAIFSRAKINKKRARRTKNYVFKI